MTREQYIVKNCPAILKMTKICDAYETTRDLPQLCKDCTDCVIKRVIDKCQEMSGKCERCQASEDYQPTDCLDYCSNDDVIFADDILQLFDIEEINK